MDRLLRRGAGLLAEPRRPAHRQLPEPLGALRPPAQRAVPGDPGGLPAESVTLAEALRGAGYRTAIVGKWHLGDAPAALPTRHGFDYWYGLPYSNDMDWAQGPEFDEILRMAADGRGAELQEVFAARRELYFDPKIDHWQVPLMTSRATADGYDDAVIERPAAQPTLTRRYTEEAERFIAESGDRPFLLYLPYAMPHTPLFASDAFSGVSPGGLYGDVIEEIDWSVGRIRAALEARGLARHTLVVFTSDNGPWLAMRHHGGSPGPLDNGKGTTFEGGMRVPAVFWWPGTVQPALVHDIGSTLDLRADPGERYDVAAAHPEVVSAIEAAIAVHREGLVDATPLFDRRLGGPGAN